MRKGLFPERKPGAGSCDAVKGAQRLRGGDASLSFLEPKKKNPEGSLVMASLRKKGKKKRKAY